MSNEVLLKLQESEQALKQPGGVVFEVLRGTCEGGIQIEFDGLDQLADVTEKLV